MTFSLLYDRKDGCNGDDLVSISEIFVTHDAFFMGGTIEQGLLSGTAY